MDADFHRYGGELGQKSLSLGKSIRCRIIPLLSVKEQHGAPGFDQLGKERRCLSLCCNSLSYCWHGICLPGFERSERNASCISRHQTIREGKGCSTDRTKKSDFSMNPGGDCPVDPVSMPRIRVQALSRLESGPLVEKAWRRRWLTKLKLDSIVRDQYSVPRKLDS